MRKSIKKIPRYDNGTPAANSMAAAKSYAKNDPMKGTLIGGWDYMSGAERAAGVA
jgi:hypothetical protein